MQSAGEIIVFVQQFHLNLVQLVLQAYQMSAKLHQMRIEATTAMDLPQNEYYSENH